MQNVLFVNHLLAGVEMTSGPQAGGQVQFGGQVAIVTGAGGGLGRSYALELARRGARLVVNDLGSEPDGSGGRRSAADAVVTEITEAGGEAVASYSSVAAQDGGEEIVRTAVDAFGKIDIVINNAGVLRDRTFARLEKKDWDAVLDVHLDGAYNVSRPAFEVMKEHGYGRLLFTSSAAGLFGNFGQSNYAAAKMGLVGLSNVLAIEGARHGITSNVIAPIAGTRLTQQILGDRAEDFPADAVTPLACYLVSPDCTTTHEVFSAGAGRYARVFVGLSSGWTPGDSDVPTVEEVQENIEQVRDLREHVVPDSALDELEEIAGALT